MSSNQKPLPPGRALNGVVLCAALTWLFYRWASVPGWEAAWLGVIVGAVGMLQAWRRLVEAHRVWEAREEVERRTRENSNIFTTSWHALLARLRGKATPTRHERRDSGWHP